MKVRKIPQRMCTGCGEMKNKRDLIRVVRSKEGEISIDLKGKKPGRGAYICRSMECLNKAIKTNRLEKNLEVKLDASIYDRLKDELSLDE
ncbi:MAG: YlxR family protein [Oscillospiraceae bacterium]|nr:YlxR family protein [Oscillospiraceae bacterium]